MSQHAINPKFCKHIQRLLKICKPLLIFDQIFFSFLTFLLHNRIWNINWQHGSIDWTCLWHSLWTLSKECNHSFDTSSDDPLWAGYSNPYRGTLWTHAEKHIPLVLIKMRSCSRKMLHIRHCSSHHDTCVYDRDVQPLDLSHLFLLSCLHHQKYSGCLRINWAFYGKLTVTSIFITSSLFKFIQS